MPFPDEAWCVAAIEQLNDDPDAAAALSGWTGGVGIVVARSSGDEVAIAIASPLAGRVPRPRVVSVRELEALEPAYFARATEADWRALIAGSLDPIAALVQRRLVARGDLTQVVARLKFRGLAERWLEQMRAEMASSDAACSPRR
jgi:hypothetical protein